ncbi:alkaline phosphatase family protein [Posidoniimonas corsicana]|nr:alkaline phosphatase family protein [Posidoniimonas corsicana]
MRSAIYASLVVLAGAACSLGATNKVLVIGVDGAGGQYITQADTPAMDALASLGGVRYDFLNEGALVDNPPAPYGASGVNWSTILTGVSATHHGVSDNSFAGSDFESYPHFFQHAKQADASLYTASLVNWTPINTFISPDAYADLEFGYDSGPIDHQDIAVRNDAVALIQNGDPDAVFLHFDQVDSAGHSHSWGSEAHLAAIEVVDGLIGDVMATVSARPGVVNGEEDWLVIVTADHGAAPGSFAHTADQGLPNWEVPFIVSGPSVADGVSLGQGTLRDVAATALWHLGVDPFEAGLDGTVRGLEVPPPNGVLGDVNQDGVVAGDGAGPAATDDVTAFLDNWLVRGGGGVADRYSRGDLNFDGLTDLSDWAVLNRLDPAMGAAVAHGLAGVGVPEHAAATLLLLLAAASPRRARFQLTQDWT